MKPAPRVEYFLYRAEQAVQEDSEMWKKPMPLGRKPAGEDTCVSVSLADYFGAVRDFLEKDNFKRVLTALSQQIKRDVTLEEIEKIRVFLEKHGEFYHPARIETVLPGITVSLVLNVAISRAGKSCAPREYRLLQKLNADYSFTFLPKVYHQGRVFTRAAELELKMFLGEWFEGYHEFHLSRDPADDTLKIVVWDDRRGNYFLTTGQAKELYRKAALILTSYYNLDTFEQIASWHHAAGDFVVKCQNGTVDVKLVTVRQYSPMFANRHGTESGAPDALVVLEALLVFFLNLAIRIRLDRLDGVGDIVWSDKMAVGPAVQGFLEGLALNPTHGMFAEPPADFFRQHLLSCGRLDLLDLNRAIANKFHPRAPDVPIIRQHLEQHSHELYDAIQQSCA